MTCLKPNLLNLEFLKNFHCKTKSATMDWLIKQNNKFIVTNCGTCWKCRQKTAREHALQISKEIRNWPRDERIFFNLTYRDANLPFRDGKFSWDRLEKDKKKFIKAIRNFNRYYDETGKRRQKKIIYYLTFEKSPSLRPHFHGILCGLKLNDLVPHKPSKNGYQLYISKTFSKFWKWGFAELGTLNVKSAAYCAQYVMKKCDETYNYQFQKKFPNERTIWKWASPGWGLKWCLENITYVKCNPKFRTRYFGRKIKELIIKKNGENAYIKHLKFLTKNKKSDGIKEWWKKITIALIHRFDRKKRRVDQI